MSVFDDNAFDDHEQVLFCRDADAGLFAIIAVHSTVLGPAAGGCRMWPYATVNQALTDVLRLSRAMTYKNALAGLPLGGGKSVIIADPAADKDEKLLTAYARFVQRLGGQYYTAEDVGVNIDDVRVLTQTCDYVFGHMTDPSPFTARGCFEGIRAAVKHKLGLDSLSGLRVAVQGVGNVGRYLCQDLRTAGAKLVVTDIDSKAVAYAVQNFDAKAVPPDGIYSQDADIFAPCALGGILNDQTIPQLKAGIVVGVANNQPREPRHSQMLHDRGILYAPDFVVNAGGMLQASGDILGEHDLDEAWKRVAGLYDATLRIFVAAEQQRRPTYEVAEDLARERIASVERPSGQ